MNRPAIDDIEVAQIPTLPAPLVLRLAAFPVPIPGKLLEDDDGPVYPVGLRLSRRLQELCELPPRLTRLQPVHPQLDLDHQALPVGEDYRSVNQRVGEFRHAPNAERTFVVEQEVEHVNLEGSVSGFLVAV